MVILKEALLPLAKAHSTFRVLEVETHHELTSELEMRVVELSKIELESESSALKLWMHFLLARDEQELEELAMTDPNIRRATEALAALSRDPEAQELARQREMAQINLKIIKQFEREGGEAKGRAEARAEGRAEGEAKGSESLLIAVDAICELLGVEFDDERKDALLRLDVAGLTALLGRLRSERQWPHED